MPGRIWDAGRAGLLMPLFRQRIECHGTKFNVPNRYQFWNDLYESANARFYLVGKTNKSWITKNTDQPPAFAASILRIVYGGGRVRILSENTESTIRATQTFIDDLIIPELLSLPDQQQTLMRQRLVTGFLYAVSDSSHYRAVVSDDRLVFIPSLNSAKFRDDALVFELSKRKAPDEFHTYISDIDRLFEHESKNIEIEWSNKNPQQEASTSAAPRT
jgi:hypothetical protein